MRFFLPGANGSKRSTWPADDPQANRYERSDLTEISNRIGAFRDFTVVFSRVQMRDFCGITVGVYHDVMAEQLLFGRYVRSFGEAPPLNLQQGLV
jgi:hypothetical protein